MTIKKKKQPSTDRKVRSGTEYIVVSVFRESKEEELTRKMERIILREYQNQSHDNHKK